MKGLKIGLVVLQIASVAAIAVFAMATSAGRAGAPDDDRIVAAALAMVYVPMLASGVLGGILASKMKRSVLGWVLCCVFLPLFGPLILASRKSLASRADATAQEDRSAPAAEDASPDAAGTAFNPGGFCRKCLSETTAESTGNVTAFNGIGTMLMGTRWRAKGLHPCASCGSVVQTKWASFGIGIKPLGTYRVIYTNKGLTTSRFFSRRLRSDRAGG